MHFTVRVVVAVFPRCRGYRPHNEHVTKPPTTLKRVGTSGAATASRTRTWAKSTNGSRGPRARTSACRSRGVPWKSTTTMCAGVTRPSVTTMTKHISRAAGVSLRALCVGGREAKVGVFTVPLSRLAPLTIPRRLSGRGFTSLRGSLSDVGSMRRGQVTRELGQALVNTVEQIAPHASDRASLLVEGAMLALAAVERASSGTPSDDACIAQWRQAGIERKASGDVRCLAPQTSIAQVATRAATALGCICTRGKRADAR